LTERTDAKVKQREREQKKPFGTALQLPDPILTTEDRLPPHKRTDSMYQTIKIDLIQDYR